MKPRFVIAKKELTGIFTERTILLAVVIQVFVAGFSSFLVVGLSALVDPASLPVGVPTSLALGPEAANDTMLLLQLGAQGVVGVAAGSDASAEDVFRQGVVSGALLKRPENGTRALEFTLLLPDGDLRSTMTLTQVKNALEAYETQLRDARGDRLVFDPIVVQTTAKAGSYAFVYSLLVPLLIFLPVVLSGALCADSLTEEVQRGTLPILLSTPATPGDVVEGKLLANVLVAPLLGGAWFFLLALNGLTVPFLGGVLILVLSTAIAYLMGLLACGIALATRDRNKAHVLYAAAMFLVLGGSLVLPVSPVNAVARLAAGSPSPDVLAVVAGTTALALLGWFGLRVALRRTAAWMAAGAA